MKAICHADWYDYESYREDQYILFDEKIVETGPMSGYPGAAEETDARGALVLPGLVNGHAHLYGAFFRGIPLQMAPRTFTELLRQFYWKIDAQLDVESTYWGARVYGLEYLRCGVTTLFDHHASGREIRGTLDALKEAIVTETGLRGLFCFETSDRYPVEDCIEENATFASNERSASCRGLFGMHASLSLSEETLSRVAGAIGDTPLHVHVAESLEDQVECINRYGCRIVERFDRSGLLNPHSILAHCVHIDDTEAAIIRERDCVAALNPSSNMNTGVGIADYDRLRRHGVRTIIGNDSLGVDLTRDYQNTLYAMHLRWGNTAFGEADLLGCIRQVYGVASTLLGIPLGRIAPGYAADLLVVPYRSPVPVGPENVFSTLLGGVYGNFHPRDVWVGGRRLLRDFETGADQEKIYAKAIDVSKKLWNRVGG